MTQYVVRAVHAHEWREIKALRLRALVDDVAPIAFLESYADASSRPDEFWQDRARRSAVEAGPGAGARQFVAIADDDWVGTAVTLVENPGDEDFGGAVVSTAGGLVVGVFVSPEHRGRGVLTDLIQAVSDWLKERGLAVVRLYVHADNVRAQRAYEKLGFRPTGKQVASTVGPEIEMGMTL